MVTLEEIQTLAKSVRDETVDNPVGQCYPASKAVIEKVVSETPATEDEVEIEEVFVGPSATIRHYVVAYPAEYISDTDAYGRILIDITLDQYTDEYKEAGDVKVSFGESIPEVLVFETKEQAPYKR